VVRAAQSAAAEELFLSDCFEKITVEQITWTAGVSRRTFFRYYKSMEDVMVERSSATPYASCAPLSRPFYRGWSIRGILRFIDRTPLKRILSRNRRAIMAISAKDMGDLQGEENLVE